MAVGRAVVNQWFGNLVTPARWDFAWMNKGLAAYLQYIVTTMVMFMLYIRGGQLVAREPVLSDPRYIFKLHHTI